MKKIRYSGLIFCLIGLVQGSYGVEAVGCVPERAFSITLKSNDGTSFSISAEEAQLMPTINGFLESAKNEKPTELFFELPYDKHCVDLVISAVRGFLEAGKTQALLLHDLNFFTKYSPLQTPELVRLFLYTFLKDKSDADITNSMKVANYLGMEWLLHRVLELQARSMKPPYHDVGIADLIALNKVPEIVHGFLDLKGKKLNSLDGIELIPNIDQVTDLLLEENYSLTELPQTIDKLVALKTLRVHNNSVWYLPGTIGNLKALEVLDLSNNQLHELPDAIGNLKKLKNLDLANNRVEKLPRTVSRLTAVQRIDLTNNRLCDLPVAFAKLVTLKVLRIKRNRFKEVPVVISSLHALRVLDIADNELSTLPDCLGSLKEVLTMLSIEGNRFTEVPDVIFSLSKLKSLNLSHNPVDEVPEAIGDLRDLEILHIADSNIERIPHSIGNLIQLSTFSVRSNQLIELPEEIGNLWNLELFLCEGNSFDSATKEFLHHLEERPELKIFV